MYRKAFLAAAVVALFSIPAQAETQEWSIDAPHTAAHFSIKHMMISNVSGAFGKVSGTVDYDGKNLDKATINATIDVNSVDTRDEHRDTHLKSPDFFDAAKFPTITFKSTKIETGKAPLKDPFKIHGNLTMHGVTKSVVLSAEPLSAVVKAQGGLHVGTSATTRVNRKDYGLNFNKTLDNGGAVVGDEVSVTLDVELVQKETAKEKPKA